jgi:hypothetical protein
LLAVPAVAVVQESTTQFIPVVLALAVKAMTVAAELAAQTLKQTLLIAQVAVVAVLVRSVVTGQ